MLEVSPASHGHEQIALYALLSVATFALLDGLDELWIDIAWLWLWLSGRLRRFRRTPGPHAASRRIAIFLPLWREHAVIGDMLAHNIATIRYANYDIFAGVYPNDDLTCDAVRNSARRWANIHMAVCPHDGPTSKADCLNWIYQRMLLYEESNGVAFDLILVHDAEDMIHPDELRTVDAWSDEYDFVQIPVLPLPTPVTAWTHAVYCDEFALAHTRDLTVRSAFGGFLPSAGVGTAYTRRALDMLAQSESNRIFDPGSLTEDYENGLRLNLLGLKQVFVAPAPLPSGPVATREYFPSTWRTAVRQRSRWVTGITLQSWQRHGWAGGWQGYWLWRDRKGLLAQPVAAIGIVVFLWCLLTPFWSRADLAPWMQTLLFAGGSIQALRTAVRIACSWRWYGPAFALLEPLREPWAAALNLCATAMAMRQYLGARVHGRPLVWLKTDHAFPTRAALLGSHRSLNEILTGTGYIDPSDLDLALSTKPESRRIGEWLVELGFITQEDLYDALAIQAGCQRIDSVSEPEPAAFMAIPARVARKWQVVPFEIRSGELHVTGSELPAPGLERDLQRFTSLKIRYYLATPGQLTRVEAGAIAG